MDLPAAITAAQNDRLGALTFVDAAAVGGLGSWADISVGVKANIAVKGLPWTAGIGAYRDRVADRDAPVVADLREKGAILLAMCNMHEAALGTVTDNPWFGRCHNPLRTGFTAGGSSGGSAAAVASGLVRLALGTDTMGSVRVPAAFCGVWGYKPGPHLLSQTGVVPLAHALDTIGLIAKTADDLVVYGADLAGITVSSPKNPILGTIPSERLANCTPEIAEHYHSQIEKIAAAGIVTKPVEWFEDPSAMRRAGLALVVTEAFAAHATMFAQNPEGFSAELQGFLKFGRDFDPAKLKRCQRVVADQYADTRWGDVDAVLTPVTPSPAHSFDDLAPDNLADFTAPANLLGRPATAVPTELAENGTGLGLQLIAQRGQDGALLGLTKTIATICET